MKLHLDKIGIFVFALLFVGLLNGCKDDIPIPKPRAYQRVNYPQRSIPQDFQSNCPFTFQFPSYAQVVPDQAGDVNRCWMNIHYEPFKADLHLSYKPIFNEDDMKALFRDSYTFVDRHNEKADAIREEAFDSGTGTGGLYWSIGGNTATAVQFFVTDSTEHFLRGSLYFMCEPNRDSLNPIIDFLEEDIRATVASIAWK